MTASPRHSVSVAAAVIRADGRILAIRRRDNGQWEPPGGILDLDETIEEGLTREVSEETGLLVEIDHLTGVYKNMTHGIIALVFRCHVISGTPRPTAEASEAAWLTPDGVRERMSPAFAIRLLDAIEDHAHGPAVRTHDGKDLLADVKARS
jgi:ADP-ribose pyrophosphatase YjhB (NUDIX family)